MSSPLFTVVAYTGHTGVMAVVDATGLHHESRPFESTSELLDHVGWLLNEHWTRKTQSGLPAPALPDVSFEDNEPSERP